MIYCSYSEEEIIEKDNCLIFVLSPDKEVFFDIDNSLTFVKKEFKIYIKSEYIKKSLSENIFKKVWSDGIVLLTLDDIKKKCLDKVLSLISLSKKAGLMIVGHDNVKKQLWLKKTNSVLLLQSTDCSKRERFVNIPDAVNVIEDFNSDQLSIACGKKNIHYLLIEGKIVKTIMNTYNKYLNFMLKE